MDSLLLFCWKGGLKPGFCGSKTCSLANWKGGGWKASHSTDWLKRNAEMVFGKKAGLVRNVTLVLASEKIKQSIKKISDCEQEGCFQ